MDNGLQKVEFGRSQIDTIKKTLMPEGTSDNELNLFLEYCKRTMLDPFARQIYATKIGGKLSIQSSIDGFRLIAERSQKYRGQTLPLYLNPKGEWTEVWTEVGFPIACKVGILRSDFDEPLYAIAKWSSYAPTVNGKLGFMWSKMPEVMLAKVAEALALRKAFPNDLSGLYSAEEMEQADTKPKTRTTTPVNVSTTSTEDVENKELVMLDDETFQKHLEAVGTINDLALLQTRLTKIDTIKNLTDEQKVLLKKAHETQIEKLTPKPKAENGEASAEELKTIEA